CLHRASQVIQVRKFILKEAKDGPRHDRTISTPGGVVSMPLSYRYTIGRVEPRFPRLSVEKEFVQATWRAGTAGLTDREVLHRVLSERQNRYLAATVLGADQRRPGDLYPVAPRPRGL